jgi:ATP/maltotriose-dependent transcriptional regulator MalT
LDQRVKPEWDSQSKWYKAVREYKQAVPLKAPAAEFCLLFHIAADMRVHYLPRLMTPQTTVELVSDTYQFEWYNRVFLAGLGVTDAPAPQSDTDAQERLRQAVKAMRQEVFDGLAWQVGAMQEHPLAKVREWGSILFSGAMRAQIRPRTPRLWNALIRHGEPYQVLLERLPATGYSAWHDTVCNSVEAIRNLIVKRIIEDVASDTLSDHLSPESLRQADQELAQWGSITLSPEDSLDDWSATQEASQRLNEIAARAGLAPREAEVLALLRQGLTQEQIGARLTPPQSRDTVKTWVERARAKMSQAARG